MTSETVSDLGNIPKINKKLRSNFKKILKLGNRSRQSKTDENLGSHVLYHPWVRTGRQIFHLTLLYSVRLIFISHTCVRTPPREFIGAFYILTPTHPQNKPMIKCFTTRNQYEWYPSYTIFVTSSSLIKNTFEILNTVIYYKNHNRECF